VTRTAPNTPEPSPVRQETPRRRVRLTAVAVPVAVVLAAAAVVALTAGSDDAAVAHGAPPTSTPAHGHGGSHGSHAMDDEDRATAVLATAAFQDVEAAEAEGYASSIGTLGCFQSPELGGMGVHYIDETLLDDQVSITEPEALVYELDGAGAIAGLVAHEYIVPVDAWTSAQPPSLFGVDFHRHPTLPLWVLHTWLWKDNPLGVFEDWNAAVRLCPEGVPVFGVDLP
jgi:hypothetical protein